MLRRPCNASYIQRRHQHAHALTPGPLYRHCHVRLRAPSSTYSPDLTATGALAAGMPALRRFPGAFLGLAALAGAASPLAAFFAAAFSAAACALAGSRCRSGTNAVVCANAYRSVRAEARLCEKVGSQCWLCTICPTAHRRSLHARLGPGKAQEGLYMRA